METQAFTSRLETRPDHLGSNATWASRRATHPQEKQRSQRTQPSQHLHRTYPAATQTRLPGQERPRATQSLVLATETAMALEERTLVPAVHLSTSSTPTARISSVQTVGQPLRLFGAVIAAGTLSATPVVFTLSCTMSTDLLL